MNKQDLMVVINSTPTLHLFLYNLDLMSENHKEGTLEWELMLAYAFIWVAPITDQAKRIAELELEKAEGLFHPWKTVLEGTVTSQSKRIKELEAKVSYVESACLDRNKIIKMQLDDKEELEDKLSTMSEQLANSFVR